ncbi:hypothetical protein A5819_003508 [Enterococcus sp. 7E2_DIV0204]|uniref:hypothetical protein n=1 Tax=unclassified Enterococcus TaxID=2608891 RepID=UPI000A3587FE|nr:MULTISPECIES: hypothetical protein [unclassified Enterococcus]OTN83958.1 hypothetical protein A5819_003508 [Enterococcus sp. 7E2_DIV0204]OTP46866.1 hypothetical protein A5884_003744 [Enterococcus sp. 7D2_DIV0200]
MNQSEKFICGKYHKRGKALFVSLLFLSSFVLLSCSKANAVQHSTLDEVMNIRDKEVIIYLARDDCPTCKKTDQQLKKVTAGSQPSIYRIETKKEPNRELLNKLIQEQNIKEVPTFLSKKNDKVFKVNLKMDQKKPTFQRLSED